MAHGSFPDSSFKLSWWSTMPFVQKLITTEAINVTPLSTSASFSRRLLFVTGLVDIKKKLIMTLFLAVLFGTLMLTSGEARAQYHTSIKHIVKKVL